MTIFPHSKVSRKRRANQSVGSGPRLVSECPIVRRHLRREIRSHRQPTGRRWGETRGHKHRVMRRYVKTPRSGRRGSA